MGTTSTIMSPRSRFLFREKLWHNTRIHTQNRFKLNCALCCDVTHSHRYPRNFKLKQFAVLSTDMKLLISAVQLPPQTTTERMEIFSASRSTDLYFVLKNQAHKRGQLIKNRPWREKLLCSPYSHRIHARWFHHIAHSHRQRMRKIFQFFSSSPSRLDLAQWLKWLLTWPSLSAFNCYDNWRSIVTNCCWWWSNNGLAMNVWIILIYIVVCAPWTTFFLHTFRLRFRDRLPLSIAGSESLVVDVWSETFVDFPSSWISIWTSIFSVAEAICGFYTILHNFLANFITSG